MMSLVGDTAKRVALPDIMLHMLWDFAGRHVAANVMLKSPSPL